MSVMMKCGHAANAKDSDGNPCCVICFTYHKDASSQIANPQPNLDGREARCTYGCKTVPSNPSLPFFAHSPGRVFDEYYCGCHGWD